MLIAAHWFLESPAMHQTPYEEVGGGIKNVNKFPALKEFMD